MDHSSLPDPAALAYFYSATFRHPLPTNGHIDVLISVAMVLKQHGRFQHHVAANLYAILGRYETPRTDDGTIIDGQDRLAFFTERDLDAKDCVFVHDYGSAKYDSMGVDCRQIGSKMNGKFGTHGSEWVCLAYP